MGTCSYCRTCSSAFMSRDLFIFFCVLFAEEMSQVFFFLFRFIVVSVCVLVWVGRYMCIWRSDVMLSILFDSCYTSFIFKKILLGSGGACL